MYKLKLFIAVMLLIDMILLDTVCASYTVSLYIYSIAVVVDIKSACFNVRSIRVDVVNSHCNCKFGIYNNQHNEMLIKHSQQSPPSNFSNFLMLKLQLLNVETTSLFYFCVPCEYAILTSWIDFLIDTIKTSVCCLLLMLTEC